MPRGFTRTELLTCIAGATVLGSLGVTLALADPSGRTERLIESLANLRAIGGGIGQYRGDNHGLLPLEMTTIGRRPRAGNLGAGGWCGWQFGGKNCAPLWAGGAYGGLFDVEAADRPLNPYLYPGFTFSAPPPPSRLPTDDPARANQQARVFRDPADANGHQRQWPRGNNPAVSCYDDVGTTYTAQMSCFQQMRGRVPGGFIAEFNEGCRRLSVDQGVDPARFVYVHDEIGEIVVNSATPLFQIQGNHGTTNQGVTLFADGHAGLITYRPGLSRQALINADYAVWFEDLGRPTAPGLPGGAAAEPK